MQDRIRNNGYRLFGWSMSTMRDELAKATDRRYVGFSGINCYCRRPVPTGHATGTGHFRLSWGPTELMTNRR